LVIVVGFMLQYHRRRYNQAKWYGIALARAARTRARIVVVISLCIGKLLYCFYFLRNSSVMPFQYIESWEYGFILFMPVKWLINPRRLNLFMGICVRKPARLITECSSSSHRCSHFGLSHSLLQPYGSSVLAGVLPVALNCCCDCPAYFWRFSGSGMLPSTLWTELFLQLVSSAVGSFGTNGTSWLNSLPCYSPTLLEELSFQLNKRGCYVSSAYLGTG